MSNMLHLHNLDPALIQVAKLLNSKKITWLLGASGALYVHGLAVIPQDLDFLPLPKMSGL